MVTWAIAYNLIGHHGYLLKLLFVKQEVLGSHKIFLKP